MSVLQDYMPPVVFDNTLPPHAQIMQMANGHIMAQAIHTLVHFNIADHIGAGAQTADELAKITKTHAPSLYRLLRYAASMGILVEEPENSFALTPLGAALRKDAPGHAQAQIKITHSPTMWAKAGNLRNTIKTGFAILGNVDPQTPFYDHNDSPERAALFNQAMVGMHMDDPAAVINAYDFSGLKTLADIGGGWGNLLTSILEANRTMRGLLYDLPSAVEGAREHIVRKGLSDRCDTRSGNFFESVPAGADAYILSHVLHDWDDEHGLIILHNIRQAMPEHGRLLVVEQVIAPENGQQQGELLDIIVMVSMGGKVRTAAEHAEILSKAGFTLNRIIPTCSPSSIIEAFPA